MASGSSLDSLGSIQSHVGCELVTAVLIRITCLFLPSLLDTDDAGVRGFHTCLSLSVES